MARVWITTGSTTYDSMVNPITAACHDGFVPDRVELLANPGVEETLERAVPAIQATVAVHGDTPSVEVTDLASDTAFERVLAHVSDGIEAAHDAGDAVAVDITPGRKFMSAIAFAAGMRYEAEHVFYLYTTSNAYYGQSFAEIPRTAARLYDFTEEL